MANGENHIEANLPFGKFSAWGRDVVLIIFIAGIGLLTGYEHFRREAEHEQILCVLGLDIWLHTSKEPKIFSAMPREYLKCIPPSIYESQEHHE